MSVKEGIRILPKTAALKAAAVVTTLKYITQCSTTRGMRSRQNPPESDDEQEEAEVAERPSIISDPNIRR